MENLLDRKKISIYLSCMTFVWGFLRFLTRGCRNITPTIVIFLFHLCFFSYCKNQNSVPLSLKVENGILDLSNLDFETEWKLNLQGEWEFYPHQLLDYSSLRKNSTQELFAKTGGGYFRLPNFWTKYQFSDGHKMDSKGYGTFRIRIILPSSNHPMGIFLPDVFTAYRLYENQKLIASRGFVTSIPSEAIPDLGTDYLLFTPEAEDLDLILQVSNFHHTKAGPFRSLVLGDPVTIRRLWERTLMLDFFIMGGLVFLGLYNIGMYFSKQRDHLPFVFALSCFGYAIRIGFMGNRLFLLLYPNFPYDLMIHINFLFVAIAPTIALWIYTKLYPVEFSKTILKIFGTFTICNSILTLIFDTYRISQWSILFEIPIFVSIILIPILAWKVVRNKRIGGRIIFVGVLISAFTGMGDLLMYLGVVKDFPFSSSLGFSFFILAQAVVISRKITHSIQISKGLAEELEKSNQELLGLKNHLEHKVDLRTQQLLQAKDLADKERSKSDRLLLNILPREIAEQLKEKGKVPPMLYPGATILFTDFQGFTKIAETLSPEELIRELDYCFTEFDKICKHFGLEKLKTIGDSYMCAAGIPVPKATHSIDACMTAIAFRKFISDLKEQKIAERKKFWELRIGIHTGSVIAGVIGEEKFAYDVWGDTVNTASRMEAAGETEKINISGQTFESVKEFFDCKYRGKIKAKNKGDIDMYYLDRLKPKFSGDENGSIPNFHFYDRYGDILYDDNLNPSQLS